MPKGRADAEIAMRSMQNRERWVQRRWISLMYSGYVTLAFYWLNGSWLAQATLDAGYPRRTSQGQAATQEFYFKRLLRVLGRTREALESGAEFVMQING